MSECPIGLSGIMIKETSTVSEQIVSPRGWDALEIKLRGRGLSNVEIQEARKSFYEGIELLSRMFLSCYDAEKKTLV
jgi:hypothetical protein